MLKRNCAGCAVVLWSDALSKPLTLRELLLLSHCPLRVAGCFLGRFRADLLIWSTAAMSRQPGRGTAPGDRLAFPRCLPRQPLL